jgi:hypothetical protein
VFNLGAKNKVIAGDYQGKRIDKIFNTVQLTTGIVKSMMLNSETVESYEVVTDEQRKSAVSGVKRGLVGGFLLGPVGMLAGGLSAKSKGIYTLNVKFKDGKKSMIEVDDKIYKEFIKNCF